MLLFILSGLWILVSEYEMNLENHQHVILFALKAVVCTLFVVPHLSGPNMMMYGDAFENSSA